MFKLTEKNLNCPWSLVMISQLWYDLLLVILIRKQSLLFWGVAILTFKLAAHYHQPWTA